MAEQAVLFIHGIGEQRPMDTLRSFVGAVWTSDTSLHRDHPLGASCWSKPYELSQNFELRRLTTAENQGWLEDRLLRVLLGAPAAGHQGVACGELGPLGVVAHAGFCAQGTAPVVWRALAGSDRRTGPFGLCGLACGHG